jgi:hypothetical protein
MIEIALCRSLSWSVACFDARQWGQGDISHGRQDKSADVRRAHVVGWVTVLRSYDGLPAGASQGSASEIKAIIAIADWEISLFSS